MLQLAPRWRQLLAQPALIMPIRSHQALKLPSIRAFLRERFLLTVPVR